MFPGFFHCFDGYAQIAQIIHRVKDTEHVYAVVRRLADNARTTSSE